MKYNTADLYRFQERVARKIDSILDDPNILSQHDRDKAASRLDRLRPAYDWLNMMQRCVKTDKQVIELDTPVATVLFDFYLLDKDVKQ